MTTMENNAELQRKQELRRKKAQERKRFLHAMFSRRIVVPSSGPSTTRSCRRS